ncbi:MAG: glycyl-radical enzyme activating protein [Clostridiales bacterium]|jgi:pyruvate formate lyase activating enzyme|nr:glycyl-radical enzyme activating protein [Clostridiales bacterium]
MNESDLSLKGRIFDIQRFSIHDGAGIRTIVFLKGCALRCRWCCNPESQSNSIQHMDFDGETKTVGRDVTAAEVMEEVIRDEPYYRRSGGGLTLSGGEALLQPDFSGALLRISKECGLTTAMESTGFGSFESVRDKILPWLDEFLMDIKHMDSAKHLEHTGQPNGRLLENARKIAGAGQNLLIRVPVIPGFNDTQEEIAAISSFAKSLPGVKKMRLLPFHQYGAGKYARLGMEYRMAGAAAPEASKMEELRKTAAGAGLDVQIGG